MDIQKAGALTLRAKYGDKEAFGELYSLIWRDLYKFALYYLGNREDAEDAVSEAVLSAYRSVAALKDPEAFKGWMFAILSNVCKKRLKMIIKQKMSISFETLELLGQDEPVSVELQSAAEVYDSLNLLSIDERAIVLLAVVNGYKSDEIASALKKPAGSVRSTLCRALKKLRTNI